MQFSKIPYLSKPLKSDWRCFIKEFMVYEAEGGTQSLNKLISPTCLRVLKKRVSMTDLTVPGALKRFIKEVTKSFGTTTVPQLKRAIRSLPKVSACTVESMMTYCEGFLAEFDACSDGGKAK
ncbi:hypothetical protein ADUPG1_003338, partial [Aduncisulcus paluster]